jgi:hypothetical protein
MCKLTGLGLIILMITMGFWFYGLGLAFSASIVLGVIVLLLPPAPVILGLIGCFGNPNICEAIAKWLGLQ